MCCVAPPGPSQCEFVVGQSASGDEVCVCVATGALRKLRFSANFSDHKRASGSRLRARGLGRPRNSVGQPRFGGEGGVFSARPGIHIVRARAPSARTPTAARLCELSGWEVGAGRLRAFGVGPGTRPTTGRVEPPRYLVVLVFGGGTRHEPPELHRRSSSCPTPRTSTRR